MEKPRTGEPPSEGLPVAIYARISRDREGAGLGVDRQEADCRALAERLGWNVVATYVDNDVSAYSGKVRPQYRQMLDDVRAGRIQGIVAWHTDRLHRRATELEEFVTLAERFNLEVQTVTAGTVDLTTASGRMVARMLGAAAQHEIDHARERMLRAKRQMAADGKYRGGQRPFGFEKNGVTIRESEARLIREATTSVLAGRSLNSIANEWNEQGVKTSQGNKWSQMHVRTMLLRPRNAGLVAHGRPGKKGVEGQSLDFEMIGKAQWPAIVDEDTWRAFVELVTDPSRANHQKGSTSSWLLSSIAWCGVEGCNALMRSQGHKTKKDATAKRAKAPPRKALYRCSEKNHLTINAENTDEFVKLTVAELLRDPRIVRALAPAAPDTSVDRERRQVLITKLGKFERDYYDDFITREQYARFKGETEAELAQIDDRLAAAAAQSVSSPVLSAIDPGQAFLDAPLDIQRAVVASAVKVTIKRNEQGPGKPWSSDRVLIEPITAE